MEFNERVHQQMRLQADGRNGGILGENKNK